MTPARLLILCLWGIIVLLVIPLYVNMAWADPVDYPRGGLGARDFKAFYIGARLLARGADPYDEGAQQAEMDALGLPRDRTFYIYPTALALALVPLANVPLETAARVWNTLNLVLLAGGLALVARAYRFDVRGSVLPTFVLGTALAYPTILSLRMGQSNILVLFFLVVVYFGNHRADVAGDSDFRSLQRLWKSSRMPGAALAVAGVVKIIPLGLFAYFLWTRKYRAAAWGMVGFAILLGASAVLLALLGQNPLLDFEYFARVLPSLTVADARIGNQSLNGFVSRVLSASGATGVVIALVSVAMVGATFAVIGRGVEDDYGFGLVLTLLLLVASISWESTLVWLVVPFAQLTHVWSDAGRPRGWLAGIVASFVLLNGTRVLAFFPNALASPWLQSLPFYGCVLLWIVLLKVNGSLR